MMGPISSFVHSTDLILNLVGQYLQRRGIMILHKRSESGLERMDHRRSTDKRHDALFNVLEGPLAAFSLYYKVSAPLLFLPSSSHLEMKRYET